jgi:hypothetical protein
MLAVVLTGIACGSFAASLWIRQHHETTVAAAGTALAA